MRLFDCLCEFEEINNTIGDSKVKGHVLVSECAECKAKREAQAIESAKQRRRQEIITELNELDRKVIRPLIDGETDKVEEIKNQKIILRTELGTL